MKFINRKSAAQANRVKKQIEGAFSGFFSLFMAYGKPVLIIGDKQ